MKAKNLLFNFILCVLSIISGNSLHAATGSMYIGQTTVPDLSVSAFGSGWVWFAETETLSLTAAYGGAHILIHCQPSDNINILYNGNITITSAEADPIFCQGSLKIDGNNGVLTLKYEGTREPVSALSVMGSCVLNSGDIKAITASPGTDFMFLSTAVYVSRVLTIKGTTNLTATAMGYNGYGINTDNDAINISTEGTVTATATGGGYAIRSNGNFIINSGTVKLSNSDNPHNMILEDRLNMNGGVLIYNNGTPPSYQIIAPFLITHSNYVDIVGQNLSNVKRVLVNNKAALEATSISDTQLRFLSPSALAGSADLVIETTAGALFVRRVLSYLSSSYRINILGAGALAGSTFRSYDVDANSVIKEPTIDTRINELIFAGWYNDINLTEEKVFKDEIITGDITLYAKYAVGSGIDESSSDKKLKITTSSETINIESEKEIKSIEVFNLDGKSLRSQQIYEKQTVIDIADLSKGVYILKVSTTDGRTESKKIAK